MPARLIPATTGPIPAVTPFASVPPQSCDMVYGIHGRVRFPYKVKEGVLEAQRTRRVVCGEGDNVNGNL